MKSNTRVSIASLSVNLCSWSRFEQTKHRIEKASLDYVVQGSETACYPWDLAQNHNRELNPMSFLKDSHCH